jgi:genome maintenance exonuclease 1
MINSPYQYHSLKRVESNHQRFYLTPDSEKLPSVTTILSATKPAADREALQRWRKRMGEKRAQEIVTEAAGRGTRMHGFLEEYVKTGNIRNPGSNPYSIQSHGMAQVIISQGLVDLTEAWGTEVNLHFPRIYAGTTDLVGVWQNEPAILDFKQTNKLKKREYIGDYFLQLTSYAAAHDELFGTRIKKGVILMCSANYEFQKFELSGDEFDHWQNIWWNRLEQYYLSQKV